MDEAGAAPLIVAMVFFIWIAILFTGFSVMLRNDGLSRNGALGIRTRATMSSDAAWSRGQKAGAPWVLAGAIAAVAAAVAGLAALFLTGFEPSQTVNAAIILSGFALVIAMIITSGVTASRPQRIRTRSSRAVVLVQNGAPTSPPAATCRAPDMPIIRTPNLNHQPNVFATRRAPPACFIVFLNVHQLRPPIIDLQHLPLCSRKYSHPPTRGTARRCHVW
ncbi:hypothetical protein GC088_13835 [Arthrobacter sp. JZ12]|uniref:SdpI family protein n=1 Tax=Arthrobacter sp. JZ12 TaxID=2654190 RepID=UPI00308BEBAD|nr:hypothetical protein GC088_13835 [Arthrobacter sp. JZ12]